LNSLRILISALLVIMVMNIAKAQNNKANQNDSNTSMYLLPPEYPMPYGLPAADSIPATIDRIYSYLNNCTPARLINKITKAEINNLNKPDTNAVIETGLFRLNSYEWGVTYGAMILASQVTGNLKYRFSLHLT